MESKRHIERYLLSLLPPPHPVVAKMERMATRRGFPIVGPLVGRFLYQLALLIGAKTVFEMGSGFGYSAYWFAKAVGRGGRVVLTDWDESNLETAERLLRSAGVEAEIETVAGDAVDVLKGTREKFDIIFNDIDKELYPLVPDLASERLREGGLLVSDNVLWRGQVVGPAEGDHKTEGVRAMNADLFRRADFFTTIVPLRDGVAVSIKRGG